MKKTETKDVVKGIVAIYKKGGNLHEVEKYLISKGRKDNRMRHDIWEANLLIKEEATLERKALINTHVKRYDKLFEEHIKRKANNYPSLASHIVRQVLVDSYVVAMQALVAKEKVLGLHTRHFRLQFNTILHKRVTSMYNFKQHKLEDLIRLNELLAKMKRGEGDIMIVDNEDEEVKSMKDVKDIDFVEVNVDKARKIKQEVSVKNKEEAMEGISSLEALKEKLLKTDLKKADYHRNEFLKKLKNT